MASGQEPTPSAGQEPTPSTSQEPTSSTILETQKPSDLLLSDLKIHFYGGILWLVCQDLVVENDTFGDEDQEYLNESIADEFLSRFLNAPLHLLNLVESNMPDYIKTPIEKGLMLKRISYFTSKGSIRNKESPVGIRNFKEIIWHGIPMLFDDTKDSLKITIGIHSGLSKTYETTIRPIKELKIEVLSEYIVIENHTENGYIICFPDEMFPELKFCRLLMTPPGTAWYDFLFCGLYDPRLLCLVWAFASKI